MTYIDKIKVFKIETQYEIEDIKCNLLMNYWHKGSLNLMDFWLEAINKTQELYRA